MAESGLNSLGPVIFPVQCLSSCRILKREIGAAAFLAVVFFAPAFFRLAISCQGHIVIPHNIDNLLPRGQFL